MIKRDKITGKISVNPNSKFDWCILWLGCGLAAALLAHILIMYMNTIFSILKELASIFLANDTMNADSKTDLVKSFEGARNLAIAFSALLCGPFLLWRIILSIKQLKRKEENTSQERESNYTALYTKSIEALGATRIVKNQEGKNTNVPAIEMRLGAIYALERIAMASWKDHEPIIEILTAYIRGNSPYKIDDKPKPITEDIHAAILVLSRRNEKWIKKEKKHLDLSNCNLTNMQITNANFYRTNFSNTSLKDTNFSHCKFDSIQFANTFIRDTSFSNCSFEKVTFNSNITNSRFSYCQLQAIKFKNLKFKSTYFDNCSLNGVSFNNLTVNRSSIHKCYVTNTYLHNLYNSHFMYQRSCLQRIFISNQFSLELYHQKFIYNCIMSKNIAGPDNTNGNIVCDEITEETWGLLIKQDEEIYGSRLGLINWPTLIEEDKKKT